MDKFHKDDDQTRHSVFDSQLETQLKNFILNEEIISQDLSSTNILNSTDLLYHQRNILSPNLEKIEVFEKRKISNSPSKINGKSHETIDISLLDEEKNKFFNEINQKIEMNKKNSIKNVCKHKYWNDCVNPNEDGSLLFYWYDAHEEYLSKDNLLVILFGKIYIKEKQRFESISVVIKNLTKKVYILPKIEKLNEPNIIDNVKAEFEKLNQNKFSFIKKGNYSVKYKKYCFEMPIPFNEYPLLKFSYPAAYPNIPSNVNSGFYFDYVFNKNNHFLENIFLSRKIKGPCWLKLRKFEQQEINLTWSKYEVICNDYKDLFVSEENNYLSTPSLKLLSFVTKSQKLNKHNCFINEINAISGYVYDYDLEKGNSNQEASFVFIKETDQKVSEGGNYRNYNDITFCQNEIILLNKFLSVLSKYDPDILVSHNLYKESMDDIINSINYLKINENWSKIGKIRRNVCPKFICGNPNLTALYQMRYLTTGRIICDTNLSLQEIIKESNFEISYLAKRYEIENRLKDKDDITSLEINYDVELGFEALEESRVCFELMNKFNILQLNKQLSNITGSLWVKSLQNSRTDRCEFILLHEFKKNKYILPDKSFQGYSLNTEDSNDLQENKQKLKIKNYEGGLVLEPKTGFYDQIVLLLDFNSLYPSIIQQYNICFTTVERIPSQIILDNRKPEINENQVFYENVEEEENLDINIIRKTESKAILPQIIESLIIQRNIIKEAMKKEKDLFLKEMLNIKQLALKLSANSLYGYLGYQHSRFYSKTMAALITKIGREILKETVKIVKQIPNKIESCALDIIYGDTDSIMVNTLTNDLKKALEIGEIIKGTINDKDKIIKIEIDNVFKNMLLLKKKRYAGLKYENAIDLRNNNFSGEPIYKKEFKGLDMVRRDNCKLSKEIGTFIMDLLLCSDKSKEEVINYIYDFLRQINADINNGKFPPEKYVISKQLVKNLEQYNDINLLPHLKVAKRLRENGDLTISSGTIINYVICKLNDPNLNKKCSEKAFHINEFKQNKNLELDLKWYKENQFLKSVNRLLKHIKEIQIDILGECLDLDKTRYILKDTPLPEVIENEKEIIDYINSKTLIFARNVLKISCEFCYDTIRIFKIDEDIENVRELLFCNSCKSKLGNMNKLMNNLTFHFKKILSKYYYGLRSCSKCIDSTRLFLKKKCSNYTCSKGKYRKMYSENDVSIDINFVNKLLEFKNNNDDDDILLKHSTDLMKIKDNIINELNRKIEFNKIDLTSLFMFLKR